MPELCQHFEDCFYDPSLQTLQWFTCLFTYSVKFEALQRLWDVIFLKGDKMIFSICLAMFATMEDLLLRCENIQEIMVVMDNLPHTFRKPHELLKMAALDPKCHVGKKKISDLRKLHRGEIIEELESY